MSDLRELLYEPWLPQEVEGPGFVGGPVLPPLATRMPEALPAGMEHGGERWQLTPNDKDCFQMFAFTLINEQAELLFIGNALKILTGGKPSFQIHASCDPAWMAAALHRLCDERDAVKETT